MKKLFLLLILLMFSACSVEDVKDCDCDRVVYTYVIYDVNLNPPMYHHRVVYKNDCDDEEIIDDFTISYPLIYKKGDCY